MYYTFAKWLKLLEIGMSTLDTGAYLFEREWFANS